MGQEVEMMGLLMRVVENETIIYTGFAVVFVSQDVCEGMEFIYIHKHTSR